MSTSSNDNELKIDINKNIMLCLDFGYGILKSTKSDIEFRNAIVSIHNGLELLMKLYLQSKDKCLVYDNIDHYLLMYGRDDLIKKIDLKKLKLNTIKFSDCIKILSHFEEIPETHVMKLNQIRNECIHYGGVIYKSEIKMILIVYIYPFIKKLVTALGLDLRIFINEKNIEAIDKLNKHFSDAINTKYIEKIERAKKHYNDELTEDERQDKQKYQDYKFKSPSKIVTCPACGKDSLLKIHMNITREVLESFYINRKNLVLVSLTCHHCGLAIDERNLLLLHYASEEKSLPDTRNYFNYFNDCPEEDCPDCPDCPEEDCPDCPDCPEEDCPDCPDCPEEDCPDCPDCPERD